MSSYEVTLPFAGFVYVRVDDAKSQEDAIQQALEKVTLDIRDTDTTELGEWEALKYITRGNVCYAPRWEAEAECLDEDDDEGDLLDECDE